MRKALRPFRTALPPLLLPSPSPLLLLVAPLPWPLLLALLAGPSAISVSATRNGSYLQTAAARLVKWIVLINSAFRTTHLIIHIECLPLTMMTLQSSTGDWQGLHHTCALRSP